MQKAQNSLSLLLLLSLLIGCQKSAPTVSTAPPATAPQAPTTTTKTAPSAMMTTQFATDDRLVLSWSLIACKHIRLDMAGQTLNVNSDEPQAKVKLVVRKAPRPDQLIVDLSAYKGASDHVLSQTTLAVGGVPAGKDGKPLPLAQVVTPQITNNKSLEPGEQVVLAKGAGAFPSLSVEVAR